MRFSVYTDEHRQCARDLAADGLGYRRIGNAIGVPHSTVFRWLHPDYAVRQLETSRAAKRRRTGVCERCGGVTRYNGTNGQSVSRFCQPCGLIVSAEKAHAKIGTGPVQRRALALLDRPRHRSELREALGISDGYTNVLLHRLIRYGLVRRVARGVYVAASVSSDGVS